VTDRVTYPWSRKVDDKYVPTIAKGSVVTWLVVPDEEATGPYNEGPRITYYNTCAVVKGDDGTFQLVRIHELGHADIIEEPVGG
jgi:hypothetical protein